jgi:hypothetical protein
MSLAYFYARFDVRREGYAAGNGATERERRPSNGVSILS